MHFFTIVVDQVLYLVSIFEWSKELNKHFNITDHFWSRDMYP